MGNNSTVVIKEGDIVKTTYNNEKGIWTHFYKNTATGMFVAKLINNEGVETNLLCDIGMQYKHSMFDKIELIDITSDMILFNELVKML